MSEALAIGPLLLPYTLLLVLACVGTTLLVGHALARSSGVEVEGALWRCLLAGIVVARLAFVLEYRSMYLAAPLSILDIRDGGWDPAFGLAAAWLVALHRLRREPALARPLRWSLAAGSALFVLGTVVLALRPDSGRPLPDLAFPSLDGRTVALAGFAGKPTVVNLWATWCAPCAREMPVLRQAQAERPDVHFVFLNQGEDAARVSAWLQSRQLALRNVLIDEQRRASAAFQQQGYPTTLFFDARGRLVASRIGELSAATLAEKLRQASR